MYDIDSLQMRRLLEDFHIKPKIPRPTAEDLKALDAATNAASSSNNADSKDDLWNNIPLHSILDTSEQQVMTPKTLLDCSNVLRSSFMSMICQMVMT